MEVLGDEVLLNARQMSEQIERPPLETFLASNLAARVQRAKISLAGQHQADTAARQHTMGIL